MDHSELGPKLNQILTRLVDHYIESAQPVSSGTLVDAYQLPMSSATARNYLAELEEAGLVIQPHTSAGRIPTEQGYALYLSQMKPAKLPSADTRALESVWQESEQEFEVRFRTLAKQLAERANEAVFVAFGKHDTYHTGLAHLFSKPELAGQDHVQMLSSAIDKLDSVLEFIFDEVPSDPTVWVGSQNPFSSQCSTVIMKYEFGGRVGVIGLLGPMRMPYQRNTALMDCVSKLLNSPLIPDTE